MPDLNVGIHNKPAAGPSQPVAEFNIFDNRHEVLRKPSAFPEGAGINNHCMGGYIIRAFHILGLRIIYKNRLKDTIKSPVIRHPCVSPTYHNIRAAVR